MELVRDLRRALSEGADLAEIRFDYLDPHDVPNVLENIKDIIPKCLFTLRSKSDHGFFEGMEKDRLSLLLRLANEKPALVDVELEALKRNDALADSLEASGARILVSWHNFDETPVTEELINIIGEMRKFSNYIKVVTMAKRLADSLRLINLYEKTAGLQAIIFAMGEAGAITRILCTVAGNAPFTYASLGKPIAPGQIPLADMKRLYDLICVRQKSR